MQLPTIGMMTGRVALCGAALLFFAACGGDDLGIGATPTPSQTVTRTATATRTPTHTPVAQAGVAGLVVVSRDVGVGEQDGLKPLPPEGQPTDASGFDRGLGHADWRIDDGAVHGATDEDGRFSITGLAPGRHTLHVTRTIEGNLMEFAVPIVVGDDGAAEVLVEVSWGLVRATSTYSVGGAVGRAVFAPNGTYMLVEGERIVELFDGWRTLVDGDRDGQFDPQGCGGGIYACDAARACGSAEDVCVCIPSCPDCEDCGRSACVPRTYFHTPECGPDGLCKRLPYECSAGDSCAVDGDQCTCVSSCFGCDNCESFACVAPCQGGQPIGIERVTVSSADRLVVGQPAQATAQAAFSDGSVADVTWLVDWSSSAPAVARIDAWGRIAALSVGETDLAATLPTAGASTPARLTVVERPTLRRIVLYNAGCYWGLDDRLGLPKPADDAFLPPPFCQQTIRIGGVIQFRALGEFDTGFSEDITDEVSWSAEPDALLTVDVAGLWTAVAAGTVRVRATLGAVSSEPQSVTIVERATIQSLAIYPSGGPVGVFDGGPVRPGDDALCFECGYSLTMLSGDTVQFGATAHYDTGEWEDVTARVAWASSAAAIAAVDAGGLVTAGAAGAAEISATLEGASSAPTAVRVVAEATLVDLSAYMDGADRAIGVGAQAVFHAAAYYDVGFGRDVTALVTWRSSDDSVGGFDSPGLFTGRAAGNVTVWAELDGKASARLPLEVFATSALDYCDAANVNRGVWADDFNRVTLESDCARYTQPDVAELRFSVTEQQRPGGIFDPCLDLEAYRGTTLVRTIREEGCGDPFLPPGALDRDEAAVRYQLKAFWDLKDEAGDPVPPGDYEIRGTFYLYYDPVVTIGVTVEAPAPQ